MVSIRLFLMRPHLLGIRAEYILPGHQLSQITSHASVQIGRNSLNYDSRRQRGLTCFDAKEKSGVDKRGVFGE